MHTFTNKKTISYQRCEACKKIPEQLKELSLCSCKMVRYCSKSCQTKDWKSHKATCTIPRLTKAIKDTDRQTLLDIFNSAQSQVLSQKLVTSMYLKSFERHKASPLKSTFDKLQILYEIPSVDLAKYIISVAQALGLSSISESQAGIGALSAILKSTAKSLGLNDITITASDQAPVIGHVEQMKMNEYADSADVENTLHIMCWPDPKTSPDIDKLIKRGAYVLIIGDENGSSYTPSSASKKQLIYQASTNGITANVTPWSINKYHGTGLRLYAKQSAFSEALKIPDSLELKHPFHPHPDFELLDLYLIDLMMAGAIPPLSDDPIDIISKLTDAYTAGETNVLDLLVLVTKLVGESLFPKPLRRYDPKDLQSVSKVIFPIFHSTPSLTDELTKLMEWLQKVVK